MRSMDIGIVTCVFVKKKKKGYHQLSIFLLKMPEKVSLCACVRESTSECVRVRERENMQGPGKGMCKVKRENLF